MSEKRRRDSTEIRYTIIRAALGGQKKTRIMYQSSLNLKQLNQYMDELIQREMIEFHPTGKYYSTTEKGKSYAKLFESFQSTQSLLREQDRALGEFFTPREKKPVAVPV